MVYKAVEVRIRDKGTFAYLRGVSDRAKKIGPKEAWNLTQTGARLIKETHLQTSEEWKGHIRKGINAKKIGKNRYGIEFSKQAMGLDSMSPHWVSLKRGRLITRWARDRGITAGAIKVHPHPYIDAGYAKMLKRLDSTANKIANKIIAR